MFNPVQFYEFGKSGAIRAFLSTWKTDNTSTGSTPNNQISLPLVSNGVYNFVVKWGDGTQDTITTFNQSQITHTYASVGTYQINIDGVFTGFRFNNGLDRLKFISVENWGVFRLVNLDGAGYGAFFGCSNLTLVDTKDILDLTNANLSSAFRSCSSLTTVNKINEWDIQKLQFKDFSAMFQSALNFNSDISAWDLTNVFSLQSMFLSANRFNQNIGSWNTSNVNQMQFMFQSNSSFNQDIGSWDVSSVTSFQSMFNNASAFNNGDNANINNWTLNSSNSVILSAMFQNASLFNQPIGGWNTLRVTSMSSMFVNSSFNQPIGNWNLTNVTALGFMFSGANNFNQDISTWNVSNVTQMQSMFLNALNFNQNIGSWNVSKVANFNSFMAGKTPLTFSTTNLDAIYNGWSSRLVKTAIAISFGTAKYTSAASSGRAILTGSPNNWVITDGGI